MRYLVVFFFLFLSITAFSQVTAEDSRISGTITNDNTNQPISNVNIINLNKVIGAVSDEKGVFILNATVNDTLLLSYIGFQSLKIRVTNDWIKNKTTQIQMTEKAIALEEIIIQPYYLTGYLEVDSKLIPSPKQLPLQHFWLSTRLRSWSIFSECFWKHIGFYVQSCRCFV